MGRKAPESSVSKLTREVAATVGQVHRESTPSFQQTAKPDTIDYFIFNALQAAGVAPADKTDDYTFIRRITLDLTGKIPTPAAVTSFVSDPTANKRAIYIDSLLAAPQWVDKWTMFYGDLLQNNASNTQIQRKNEGRNASLCSTSHDSLAANKPYNKMAAELLSAEGANSFDQTNGQLNYLVGGYVTGGPSQDIFDGQRP